MVTESDLPEESESAMKVLLEEKDRLTKSLNIIHNQISEIKSEYPYTMKELVQNPEQIAERKAELEELIEELKEIYGIYKTRLEGLTGDKYE